MTDLVVIEPIGISVVEVTPASIGVAQIVTGPPGANGSAGGGPHTHPESDVVNLVSDLASKANASDVATALALKADTSALASKADTSALTSGLASKADSSALTSGLAGKANTSHSHSESDITGLVTDLAGKSAVGHTHTKSDVGLSNVDNTADTAKPVSTAQQTALNLKANLASPAFTGTPTGITKSHVGLGNVDNTADASKPVSTATQTALDLKADASALTSGLATKASTTHSHAESDITGLVTDLAGKASATHTHAQSDVTGLTTALSGKQATGNYITALTGDVTASGPGSASAALSATSVTAGTYSNPNISVDSKGRLTAASSGVTTNRPSYAAPTTWWMQPNHIVGTGAGSPASGNVYFTPIDIGPNSLTSQNFGCWCTTALVLGSGGAATVTVGVYPDNGTGGLPLTTSGPIASNTMTVTTTGARTTAISTTLTPARYWLAFIYYATGTITTAPSFTCIASSVSLGLSTSTNLGTSQRYITVQSQTGLPTGSVTLLSGSAQTSPVVAIQVA